jgi:hypothetical protein
MPRSALPAEVAVGLDDRRADRGRALALVWAGMVLGASCLATPAKFLSPSLPRPVTLDVGRYTFRVFGRAEMALAALLGLRAVEGGAPSRSFLHFAYMACEAAKLAALLALRLTAMRPGTRRWTT